LFSIERCTGSAELPPPVAPSLAYACGQSPHDGGKISTARDK
jgi:hypothetical protein